MDSIKKAFRQLNPGVKIVMGALVLSGAFYTYRYVYVPYEKKKRYVQAQEWARIIEREEPKEPN